MTTQTTLAPWAQIIDPRTGATNPYDYLARRLGGNDDNKYDLTALFPVWMDRINEALAGYDPDIRLDPATGDLYGAETTKILPARDRAKQIVVDEIDAYALAQDHDRSAGPYAIGVRPAEGIDMNTYPPNVYQYDTEEPPITRAQAVADARKTYAEETGLPQEKILHVDVFGEQRAAAEPFAPVDPTTSTTILTMNAVDLLHRTVTNPNGAEFHVDRLELDARSGTISIWLTEYDEDGNIDPDASEVGVYSLAGWTVS